MLAEMFSIKYLRRRIDLNSLRKRRAYVDYPFLRNNRSVRYISKSKVLFIMRGLPGSGKSFVAQQITHRYKKSSIVCSADRYFMIDGQYAYNKKQVGDAHKYCQETCKKAMLIEKRQVVIDNTNVQKFEMQTYLNLAKENNYVTLIIEPKTPWKFDVDALASKNTHRCSSDYIEIKKGQYVDIKPLYWGFFLNEPDSKCIRKLARSNFLECVKLFPDFALQIGSKAEGTSFYETYYNIENNKILHSTTCFASHATSSYSSEKVVLNSLGKCFKLRVSGFIFTPRVAAVVIDLKPSQLVLWNCEDSFSYVKDEQGHLVPSPASKLLSQKIETDKDAESSDAMSQVSPTSVEMDIQSGDSSSNMVIEVKEDDSNLNVVVDIQGNGASSDMVSKQRLTHIQSNEENVVIEMKRGSRAHMTVGHFTNVPNVQSGYDVLSLKHMHEGGHFKQVVYQKNLTFIHYGDAGCEVQFDWAMDVESLFAGNYGNL